jgi:metal transporter CNNM
MSDEHDLTTTDKIVYSVACAVLVCSAGVVSGLNLALFSIDPIYVRIQGKTGTPQQQRYAEKLLPLLKHQHLTLVALLVSNASLATALPLFLERLLNPTLSLVVSVTAVLFFGEVLPQATFVRRAVPVCSFLSPFIWCLIAVTFVVSYPFAKLLDVIIGHKEEAMEKDQLGAFFQLHEANPNQGELLLGAEVNVMRGAMALSTKIVKDVLTTTVQETFMLSSSQSLCEETIESIVNSGYSRIPVCKDDNRRHILGALLTKSLLPLAYTQPDPAPLVGDYHLSEVLRISEETSLYNVYESFQSGFSNMAVVYNAKGTMVGLLTLEDIFEVMHNMSITDETDLNNDHPLQVEMRQKELMQLYHQVKVEHQRTMSVNALS